MGNSKLWAVFSPNTPIFKLEIGSKTFTDDDIVSISITRGGGSYGSTPSVLEVVLAENHVFYRNEHVTLKMSVNAARRVSVTSDQIVDRFTGRLAEIEITDNGDGNMLLTTIRATSYSALMRQSPVKIAVAHRDAISEIVSKAIAAPRLQGKTSLYELASTAILDSGRAWTGTTEPIYKTFKEVLSDYVEPVKTLLVDRRDGTMRFMTLALRLAVLSSQVHKSAPLRDHVLAPAKWIQSNEIRANHLRYLWREHDGTITTKNYEATSALDALVTELEPVETDMSNLLVVEETRELIRLAQDGAVNAVQRGYEQITVDSLELLSRGSDYARYVAFEMLRLEHGDAIYFGGDWTRQNVPMVNTEIREIITAEKWEFQIKLATPRAVIGAVTSPPYPPQVWDQATNRWDEETRTWEQI